MPKPQQADLCALTILSMADIKPQDDWNAAKADWIRIHDVIAFAKANYNTTYAENSRETFRKQAMHHFRTAALIEDNGKATNSPNYRYRLTNEFLAVIRDINDDNIAESKALQTFCNTHTKLTEIYASKKANAENAGAHQWRRL